MFSLKFKILTAVCVLILGCVGYGLLHVWMGITERLDRAEENVRSLQISREKLDKVLLQQRQLEKSILGARHERNRELEKNIGRNGTVGTADLLRMLEEDATARRDRASARVDGTLYGTGNRP